MIYLINMLDTKYYKVGYTSNATAVNRLAALQTGCPRRLILLAEGDGNEKDEANIHLDIWRYHTDGGDEWFELPDNVANKLIIKIGGINYGNNKIQRSISGPSPLDVRPLCGRQQHQVTVKRENVSGQPTAHDNASTKHNVPVVRRKHEIGSATVLR
jgi:hypothetical protein